MLEGYTYFKDEALKHFLGPYWFLVYILPIFTSLFPILHETRKEAIVKEDISTAGDYSPGKVEGDYKIGKVEQVDSSNPPSKKSSKSTPAVKPAKSIRTKGKYSPGEVGGDYTVEK